ncbi:MAG TPA: hypothetical protein VGB66_07225 [Longimicrobium sp.]|jgi:hypothetical protein
MTHTHETQGRHARDRNVFARDDRPGPYETSYDVRRGYDEPNVAPHEPVAQPFSPHSRWQLPE